MGFIISLFNDYINKILDIIIIVMTLLYVMATEKVDCFNLSRLTWLVCNSLCNFFSFKLPLSGKTFLPLLIADRIDYCHYSDGLGGNHHHWSVHLSHCNKRLRTRRWDRCPQPSSVKYWTFILLVCHKHYYILLSRWGILSYLQEPGARVWRLHRSHLRLRQCRGSGHVCCGLRRDGRRDAQREENFASNFLFTTLIFIYSQWFPPTWLWFWGCFCLLSLDVVCRTSTLSWPTSSMTSVLLGPWPSSCCWESLWLAWSGKLRFEQIRHRWLIHDTVEVPVSHGHRMTASPPCFYAISVTFRPSGPDRSPRDPSCSHCQFLHRKLHVHTEQGAQRILWLPKSVCSSHSLSQIVHLNQPKETIPWGHLFCLVLQLPFCWRTWVQTSGMRRPSSLCLPSSSQLLLASWLERTSLEISW